MYKNNKLIFLSVAVVFIWGMIAYRIYDQIHDDSIVPTFTRQVVSDTLSAKTFVLNLSYNDPFLKAATPSKTTVERAKVTSQSKIHAATPVPVVVDWQRIVYAGFVVNATRNIRTATLRVDNTEVFLKEGEEYNGFKVLAIFSDSLLITFEGARQFVKKKQR